MGKEMENLAQRGESVIMHTYSRYPVALEKGEGAVMWDADGKQYIDFVAGIAVNSLGSGHKALCETLAQQAKNLIHCSNLYYTRPQIELAERLVKYTEMDKVFFCNSGAEANEAALKLCRKYAAVTGKAGTEILTMERSFHGRTYGAVTATGQEKYHKNFGPLLPSIGYVPYNDFEALEKAVTENTCGILMEVIQGEGGIIPADKEFLKAVRYLCDEKDILLVFDEVQTGVGRTGTFLACQSYDVMPDMVTLAKGLAGGVPIGALLAKEKAARAFEPGDHASTFGGNPLAASAGCVVMDELMKNGLLEQVKIQGEYLRKRLEELKAVCPIISDVRGMGLMQGIELTVPTAPVIGQCMEKGLLLTGAGGNVIRFVPPLVITKEQIDHGLEILGQVLKDQQKGGEA